MIEKTAMPNALRWAITTVFTLLTISFTLSAIGSWLLTDPITAEAHHMPVTDPQQAWLYGGAAFALGTFALINHLRQPIWVLGTVGGMGCLAITTLYLFRGDGIAALMATALAAGALMLAYLTKE